MGITHSGEYEPTIISSVKTRLYTQAYCNTCAIPVGLSGQSPAYASEEGTWECKVHIDKALRQRIDGDRRKLVTRGRNVPKLTK